MKKSIEIQYKIQSGRVLVGGSECKCTHIRCSIYYRKSWHGASGYFLSIDPCTIESTEFGESYGFTLGTGVKRLILAAKRYSDNGINAAYRMAKTLWKDEIKEHYPDNGIDFSDYMERWRWSNN